MTSVQPSVRQPDSVGAPLGAIARALFELSAGLLLLLALGVLMDVDAYIALAGYLFLMALGTNVLVAAVLDAYPSVAAHYPRLLRLENTLFSGIELRLSVSLRSAA